MFVAVLIECSGCCGKYSGMQANQAQGDSTHKGIEA